MQTLFLRLDFWFANTFIQPFVLLSLSFVKVAPINPNPHRVDAVVLWMLEDSLFHGSVDFAVELLRWVIGHQCVWIEKCLGDEWRSLDYIALVAHPVQLDLVNFELRDVSIFIEKYLTTSIDLMVRCIKDISSNF